MVTSLTGRESLKSQTPRISTSRLAGALAVVAVSAALMFAFAPAAMAGDSSVEGYGGKQGSTQSKVEPGSAKTRGSLPFTGLDLGLLVVGGAGLVLVGGYLRRLSRSPA